MLNKVYKGDSIDYLKKIENESIDVIFSDPPYGTGKEREVQRRTNKHRHKYKIKDTNKQKNTDDSYGNEFKKLNMWDYIDDNEFWEWFIPYIDECNRVLRKGGYIIMWFDRDKINFLSAYLKKNGFKLRNYIADVITNPVPKAGCISWMNSFGMIGIWIKSGGKYTYNGKELGQHSEHFIWQTEADGLITRPILSGKERYKDATNKAFHPTQKPEHICKDIIEYFSNENEVILDPFMGIGTIPVVAKQLNRNFIGIEKVQKYFDLAKKRLDETKKINNKLKSKFFKV